MCDRPGPAHWPCCLWPPWPPRPALCPALWSLVLVSSPSPSSHSQLTVEFWVGSLAPRSSHCGGELVIARKWGVKQMSVVWTLALSSNNPPLPVTARPSPCLHILYCISSPSLLIIHLLLHHVFMSAVPKLIILHFWLALRLNNLNEFWRFEGKNCFKH